MGVLLYLLPFSTGEFGKNAQSQTGQISYGTLLTLFGAPYCYTPIASHALCEAFRVGGKWAIKIILYLIAMENTQFTIKKIS